MIKKTKRLQPLVIEIELSRVTIWSAQIEKKHKK